MSNLTLELNINFASNLVNVNLFTKMDVYAVASIRGDGIREMQKVKTPVHRSGGSNPTWNHNLKFSVNKRLARNGRLTLAMRLISRRVLGNKDIGGVNIPIVELLNYAPSLNDDGNNQEMKLMTYQVRTLSGKWSGSLTFSYRFKPDSLVTVNQNLVDTPTSPPSSAPPSPIEHPSSAPPEPSIEFPKLPEPPCHLKHPFAAGSSDDPRPISEGCRMLMEQASRIHNHNHMPPLPSYQLWYESNGYAPMSSSGTGNGGINNQMG